MLGFVSRTGPTERKKRKCNKGPLGCFEMWAEAHAISVCLVKFLFNFS